MAYSAEDLLLEREQRVDFIDKLLYKYNRPVMFIRVNYPGLNKSNPVTEKIMQCIDIIASDKFKDKILMKLIKITAEGPTITMVLEEESVEVKKTAIQIEDEHTLGRCVDMDVYNPKTLQGMSRVDFDIGPRKCFLCEDTAHNCVRSRKHSQADIIKFIHGVYEDYMKANEHSCF